MGLLALITSYKDMLNKNLKEYVETGEYFLDARSWYNYKYVHPFSERSFIIILSLTVGALFLGIIINLHGLFPIVNQVKYSISSEVGTNSVAEIIRADRDEGDSLLSIADIMTRNYTLQREAYNYDLLKQQFMYIKNNSTRITYKRFYDYMNIDNPASPMLRYQKDIKRNSSIISSKFLSPGKAEIKFNSLAKNSAGEIFEDSLWLAAIDFEIDEINPNLPNGSRFNFTVTDYQLKLLEDRKKK